MELSGSLFVFTLFKLSPKVIVCEGGQNTINNVIVRLYCKITRTPYIIWDLGRGYQDFGHSLGRKIYMFFYKKVIRSASLIYGYNSSSEAYFISLGIQKNKIVTLNNTIDTISAKNIINKSSAKMPVDLESIYSKDIIYLIFVGSLLPTKRIEDLVELMNKLECNYHLLIVGAGEKPYEDKLKELFIGTNHTFMGYKRMDELLPYYNVSSFAILPGLGGLSINQAMAFGLPVLCTHADGAEKDIVRNNETGYIYSTLDEAVVYIKSKSKEEWKTMGDNAKKILFSEFSIEKESDRFIEGLNQTINGYHA
jgi:Glycosyltransferase